MTRNGAGSGPSRGGSGSGGGSGGFTHSDIATLFEGRKLKESIKSQLNYKGQLFYPKDSLNRPRGVLSVITRSRLDTGSQASQYIEPPGWSGDGNLFNEARGHLQANMLGGSGRDSRNLVTLEDKPLNNRWMKLVENEVYRHVKDVEPVLYQVVPEYKGTNLAPIRIHIQAIGLQTEWKRNAILYNAPGERH